MSFCVLGVTDVAPTPEVNGICTDASGVGATLSVSALATLSRRCTKADCGMVRLVTVESLSEGACVGCTWLTSGVLNGPWSDWGPGCVLALLAGIPAVACALVGWGWGSGARNGLVGWRWTAAVGLAVRGMPVWVASSSLCRR